MVSDGRSRRRPQGSQPPVLALTATHVPLSVSVAPQCIVGHRDESADHGVLWPHRRRHELVPVSRLPHICVGSLRRLSQAVGRQGQHVPADLHGPRVRHQRHLCERN